MKVSKNRDKIQKKIFLLQFFCRFEYDYKFENTENIYKISSDFFLVIVTNNKTKHICYVYRDLTYLDFTNFCGILVINFFFKLKSLHSV